MQKVYYVIALSFAALTLLGLMVEAGIQALPSAIVSAGFAIAARIK